MTTETATTSRDEILAHEKDYFEAVRGKDADTIAKLTAREAIVVGPQGMQVVNPDAMRQMVAEHDVTARYEVDGESTQFIQLTPDVAVLAYRLRTTPNDGGGASESYDTDVWVRRDGRWTCAAHCETPAATPGS